MILDLVQHPLVHVHARRDPHPPRVTFLAQQEPVDVPHVNRHAPAVRCLVGRQHAIEISEPQRGRLRHAADRHLAGRIRRFEQGIQRVIHPCIPLGRGIVLPAHIRLIADQPGGSRVRQRGSADRGLVRTIAILRDPHHLPELDAGWTVWLDLHLPVQVPADAQPLDSIAGDRACRTGHPNAKSRSIGQRRGRPNQLSPCSKRHRRGCRHSPPCLPEDRRGDQRLRRAGGRLLRPGAAANAQHQQQARCRPRSGAPTATGHGQPTACTPHALRSTAARTPGYSPRLTRRSPPRHQG